MPRGTVFDIREFCVHDGPGIRTTVFLKGCPLRCQWCHNPEGLSPDPQELHYPGGVRIAGRLYEPEALAALLNAQAEILHACGGGVTFSGGEPLFQAEFLAAVLDLLTPQLHVAIETSGYAPTDDFVRIIRLVDLVYMDLKLIDPEGHRHFTGADNALILRNLATLPASGVPFIIRVPLIPGVTDTPMNLDGIAEILAHIPGLDHVELLAFNPVAGGKYHACGMPYQPEFSPSAAVRIDAAPFTAVGIKVKVLS